MKYNRNCTHMYWATYCRCKINKSVLHTFTTKHLRIPNMKQACCKHILIKWNHFENANHHHQQHYYLLYLLYPPLKGFSQDQAHTYTYGLCSFPKLLQGVYQAFGLSHVKFEFIVVLDRFGFWRYQMWAIVQPLMLCELFSRKLNIGGFAWDL